MFPFLLLAQVVTATPAAAVPTVTPAPAVATAAGSVSAAPRTLADVARERKEGKKGVEGGTLSVAGKSGPPERVAGDSSASAEASVSAASARVRAAEAEVRAARRALDDAATHSGMTSEDAAAKRARLHKARKELAEARDAAARSKK